MTMVNRDALMVGAAKRVALFALAALVAVGVCSAPAAAKPEKGKVFEDWGVVCETQADKSDKCFAQQVQTAKEGGKILTIAIGYIGAKGEAAVVAQLPLGINLQVGAAMKIDEGTQFPLTVQTCAMSGCQVATQLSDAQMKALANGKTVTIGMVAWGKTETTVIPVPLKGLSASLAASR
ncbi:conserved exported hypothetical protein [Candidatus Terasakiella magnetica]|nr:conserved exported hypothetical protein [Candidatus Terasakiella magnetica]